MSSIEKIFTPLKHKISRKMAKNEEFRVVYNALSDERIDYNNRKWETVRTMIALTASFWLIILGAGLIFYGISIASWVKRNVERESKAQFFAEFSMYQIEKLWGLHDDIEEENIWLKKYPKLFGELHLNFTFRLDGKATGGNLEEWANIRVQKSSFVRMVTYIANICTTICVIIGSSLIITTIIQTPMFFHLLKIWYHLNWMHSFSPYF
jgi:hypothetical protein